MIGGVIDDRYSCISYRTRVVSKCQCNSATATHLTEEIPSLTFVSCSCEPGLGGEGVERALLVREQVLWRVIFDDLHRIRSTPSSGQTHRAMQATLTLPASSTSTRSDSRMVFTRCLTRTGAVSDENWLGWGKELGDVRDGEHRDVRELRPADDLLDCLVRVEVDSRRSCVRREVNRVLCYA